MRHGNPLSHLGTLSISRPTRCDTSGAAAAIYRGNLETPDGIEPWAVKVPLQGVQDRGSLGIREFVGGRVAHALELPVLPCQPARLIPHPPDSDLAGDVGPPYAASPFIEGIAEVSAWAEVPDLMVARLVAYTFALNGFDRMRARGPRDVFKNPDGQFLVLDHEAFPQGALVGTEPRWDGADDGARVFLRKIDGGSLRNALDSVRVLGEQKQFFEELANQAVSFGEQFDPARLQAWVSGGASSLEATCNALDSRRSRRQ